MTDPVPHLTSEALGALPGVRHAFFTREGGVSEGVYSSLNTGYGSGDDPDRVTENRRRAMAALSREAGDLNTVYQVHGRKAVPVERPWPRKEAPKADAMVADRPGVVLGILTADCLPALFADAEAGVIGAAHAGWRGLLAGILEATVEAMEALGAERRRIHAALGPAIGRKSYEVGPEFPAPFLDADPDNADFFEAAHRDGHHLFDLQGCAARALATLDLAAIEPLSRDTCAEDANFFSYRRTTLDGGGDYGRGLSAIVLAG